jgi:hypothetical protein
VNSGTLRVGEVVRSEEIIVAMKVVKKGNTKKMQKCGYSLPWKMFYFAPGVYVYDLSIFKDRNGSSDLPHFSCLIFFLLSQ